MIGSKTTNSEMTSEAQSHFGAAKSQSQMSTMQKEKNLSLAAKLKGHNFSLREQKQGGQVNNYYQRSHNATFNDLGNPNAIRSVIPEAQKADARKEHYCLGFENNFKAGMNQTY